MYAKKKKDNTCRFLFNKTEAFLVSLKREGYNKHVVVLYHQHSFTLEKYMSKNYVENVTRSTISIVISHRSNPDVKNTFEILTNV